MIRHIRERVATITTPVGFSEKPEAAILIPITDENDPHLVLTKRAEHLSSHAGEVAFPGGKRDLEDNSLQHTALRESEEEIGLPASAVDILGALKPATSKFGLRVTPFVGLVDPAIELLPNLEELDHIFHVPVEYFIDNLPNEIYEAEYDGQTFQVPCYKYEGQIIWGLTAYFIAEFMNSVFDTDIKIHLRANKK